ncbi:aldo/keto reductase [Actinoplanes sp. NPDC051411]|uniref:aldo/keto reductase n=1 Tax=Actinoplanes sp. NPDC051411 TaxID=3155522 RepID=UPI003444DC3F
MTDTRKAPGGSGPGGSGPGGSDHGGTGPGGPGPGGTGHLGDRPGARIGFGAMQLVERLDGRPPVGEDIALRVLRDAAAFGVDHIDTAEFYGEGTANQRIRAALFPYAESLAVVTKVGAERAGATLVPAQRPEQLRAQVEANLTTLGTDHVAVVNLRRADAPPGIVAEGDQRVDLDAQLAELIALRDEGKIGGIGLSAVTADQVRQALPAGIVGVQNLYSLLDRSAEEVLDVCREHGLAWVPFFPLGSSHPRIPKATDHPAVIATAGRLGATPAQVALAWLLAHYDNTLLIPGTSDPAHLTENVAAGDVHLDAAALAALDAADSHVD